MGLTKSGTINRIDPLSSDPLSGLDCSIIILRDNHTLSLGLGCDYLIIALLNSGPVW